MEFIKIWNLIKSQAKTKYKFKINLEFKETRKEGNFTITELELN